MKVKRGVTLYGLQLPMRIVLIEASHIWSVYGKELVVTSTTDGVHSPESLHPFGFAVDLRTRYFSAKTISDIARILQATLSRDYKVLVEKTHIHVHYKKAVELAETN